MPHGRQGPSPSAPTEDGRIMYARAMLERHWFALTDDQRNAWLTRWETLPPQDIAGRVYITTTPDDFGQVMVAEPTAYAWSQIYATYRFGLDPLDEPSDDAAPVFHLDALTATEDELTVDLSTDSDPLTDSRVIVYATAPTYSTLTKPQYRLRPLGFFTGTDTPTSADLIDFYLARWTPVPGLQVAVRAAIIGPNNEHVITEELLSALVA